MAIQNPVSYRFFRVLYFYKVKCFLLQSVEITRIANINASMETERQPLQKTRPQITDYTNIVEYFRDMIAFRKASEKNFSVLSATQTLRRVSPALISLILKGKRNITLDRIDEYAKLLTLNSQEKFFLKNWLLRNESLATNTESLDLNHTGAKHRKEISTHILQDWVNVYVKDSFQLGQIQKNPKLIYQSLGHHANPQRIDKSIQFLLREGYLRKTIEGRTVIDTQLAFADQNISSKKVRQFHKNALHIAKNALDLYPTSERHANTMTIPLNEKSYGELIEIIREFAQKMQDFAAQSTDEGDRLYQVVLNLSPAGGKIE